MNRTNGRKRTDARMRAKNEPMKGSGVRDGFPSMEDRKPEHLPTRGTGAENHAAKAAAKETVKETLKEATKAAAKGVGAIAMALLLILTLPQAATA